jgi:hypothetical protein
MMLDSRDTGMTEQALQVVGRVSMDMLAAESAV